MAVEWQRSKGARTDHMKRRALIVRRHAWLCRRRVAELDEAPEPAPVDAFVPEPEADEPRADLSQLMAEPEF